MTRTLGEEIRRARKQRGMTQAALAECLGCTEGYVAHIEHGRSLPSDAKLLHLCECLELDPRQMIHLRQREKASGAIRPFFDEPDPSERVFFRESDRLSSEQLAYARRIIRAVESNRRFKAILDVMLEEEEQKP